MLFVYILIAILVIFLIGLIIFSWRNAAASVKPKLIPAEREINGNKKRGLWLDYDSYDKQDYTIEGKDGYILHTTFVSTEKTRGTGKYVIICHGHTSSRNGAVKYVNCYIKLGFSCITYDARTHGENKPDKCTLGYVESEDLKHVIDDTRSRYSDLKVLGLQGESMGSSTSLHVLRFDPKIDFIVSDCCFIGTYEEVRDCYKNIHLQCLMPFVWLAGKIIYKVDIKKTNALRCLAGHKTPILFIHGSGDTFVKPYNAQVLHDEAKKNGAYTELIYVEGAGHAMSRQIAGFDAYTGYIENFLNNIGIV
jgi:Lysophospholipase